MSSPLQPLELKDRWSFPLDGALCTATKPIRWEIILLVQHGEADAAVRFRLACAFELDGSPMRVDTVDAALVEARLSGRTVRRIDALKSGELLIDFDGEHLAVPVDQNYESWTATTPDGFKLVALPGGGLAVWDA